MSPAKKASPVPPRPAKPTALAAEAAGGGTQKDLAFLIVGVIALLEGLALILLARSK
jgi:hypothetical protein